ncbi:MAG: hypothetical protein ACYC0Q_09960 [Eubacteriales bacterium]
MLELCIMWRGANSPLPSSTDFAFLKNYLQKPFSSSEGAACVMGVCPESKRGSKWTQSIYCPEKLNLAGYSSLMISGMAEKQ